MLSFPQCKISRSSACIAEPINIDDNLLFRDREPFSKRAEQVTIRLMRHNQIYVLERYLIAFRYLARSVRELSYSVQDQAATIKRAVMEIHRELLFIEPARS